MCALRPQVALRTNQLGVLYWDDSIPLAALLAEDGTIDGQTFLSTWRTLPQVGCAFRDNRRALLWLSLPVGWVCFCQGSN